MRRERRAITLQTTALANEAWLRLADCFERKLAGPGALLRNCSARIAASAGGRIEDFRPERHARLERAKSWQMREIGGPPAGPGCFCVTHQKSRLQFSPSLRFRGGSRTELILTVQFEVAQLRLVP